jgi:mercuric ion binding protein
MRYRLFLFIFFLSGTIAGYAQSNSAEIIIKTNIYCDHCRECETCQERIIQELKFTKGIKEAELDINKSEIRVVYSLKKTDAGKIRAAINKAGYDADDQPATAEYTSGLDDCCKKK